jgi:REP element-mobilizing transposase RayT
VSACRPFGGAGFAWLVRVTAPRCLFEGDTYLVTRRCTQRQFLLKPERYVTQVLTYVLAVAAAAFGIELHATIFLSNHYHLVLTDPRRRLPLFVQQLNSLVARALNQHWRRSENLWNTQGVSVVRLVDERAVWNALVYTITNAVKDGLVSEPSKWGGLRTTPAQLPGLRKKALRPGRFFREDGELPAEAELVFSKPPLLRGLSDGAYQAQLAARVRAEVDRIKQKRREAGRKRFLGWKAVLRQAHHETPNTPSPGGKLNPTFAAGGRTRREAEKEGLKAWRQRYWECFEAWRGGARDVSFPAGTWGMVVLHGAAHDGLGVPGG